MCGHDRRRARRLLILAHDRGSKLTDDGQRQLRENQTHGGETSRSLSSG
jgi:hypothetical protein